MSEKQRINELLHLIADTAIAASDALHADDEESLLNATLVLKANCSVVIASIVDYTEPK